MDEISGLMRSVEFAQLPSTVQGLALALPLPLTLTLSSVRPSVISLLFVICPCPRIVSYRIVSYRMVSYRIVIYQHHELTPALTTALITALTTSQVSQ